MDLSLEQTDHDQGTEQGMLSNLPVLWGSPNNSTLDTAKPVQEADDPIMIRSLIWRVGIERAIMSMIDRSDHWKR